MAFFRLSADHLSSAHFAYAIESSQTSLFDVPMKKVARLKNAAANHNIPQEELAKKLSIEIHKSGPEAVNKYFSRGKNGKHFSHIKSRKNCPKLANDPNNIILEDGTRNIRRGAKDMTRVEVAQARAINNWHSFETTLRNKQFRNRALCNSALAAVFDGVITGVDQILQKRDILINGDSTQRRQAWKEVGYETGKSALAAVPVSLCFSVAMAVPAFAAIASNPIGIGVSITLMGQKLYRSAVANPSAQELKLGKKIKSTLGIATHESTALASKSTRRLVIIPAKMPSSLPNIDELMMPSLSH